MALEAAPRPGDEKDDSFDEYNGRAFRIDRFWPILLKNPAANIEVEWTAALRVVEQISPSKKGVYRILCKRNFV
jgi:hypothetical protein